MSAEPNGLYKVVATDKAMLTIFEESAYYSANGGPELAKRWELEVTAAMDSLQRFPNRGMVARFGSDATDVRRLLMRNFPYFVYYVVDDFIREVEVVYVIHTARNQDAVIKTLQ